MTITRLQEIILWKLMAWLTRLAMMAMHYVDAVQVISWNLGISFSHIITTRYVTYVPRRPFWNSVTFEW